MKRTLLVVSLLLGHISLAEAVQLRSKEAMALDLQMQLASLLEDQVKEDKELASKLKKDLAKNNKKK